MPQVQFYHLTASNLERALPSLLNKAYQAGFRILVTAESETQMQSLNQLLWTYDPDSFLPHGSVKDGNTDQHPILISTEISNDNTPQILAITDGRQLDNLGDFEKILDIFDGNNSQATEKARERWKHYQDSGHDLIYNQQSETGSWQQK